MSTPALEPARSIGRDPHESAPADLQDPIGKRFAGQVEAVRIDRFAVDPDGPLGDQAARLAAADAERLPQEDR